MNVFRVDGKNPRDYMRMHLRPIEQPMLSDTIDPCPVFYNVVSNVKLDPVEPLRILKILSLPCSEVKYRFGAAILRFMHSLTKDQARIPQLKSSATTHLYFEKGALGSTGNRSEDEARLGCHEFRMLLFTSFGIRTNFRRFTIPNMVCSSSVGYCINLARMHASDQVNTDYYPDLFPGLFYYYKHVFKDRQTIHQRIASAPSVTNRKVQLLEEDLVQLHKHTNSSSRYQSDDVVRAQVKNMLDSYLPKFKYIVVLVFVRGKVVGLGPQDRQAATEAFKHVAEVSKEFRVSEADTAEFLKRRKAQDRLGDKNEMLEEKQRVNYSNPFSSDTRRKMDQIANTIEDEAERKARIKAVLQAELINKKKGRATAADSGKAKKRKKSTDEDDEDLFGGVENDEWDEINKDMLDDMLNDEDDLLLNEDGSVKSSASSGGSDASSDQERDEDAASSPPVGSAGYGKRSRYQSNDVMGALLANAERSRMREAEVFEDMPDLCAPEAPVQEPIRTGTGSGAEQHFNASISSTSLYTTSKPSK